MSNLYRAPGTKTELNAKPDIRLKKEKQQNRVDPRFIKLLKAKQNKEKCVIKYTTTHSHSYTIPAETRYSNYVTNGRRKPGVPAVPIPESRNQHPPAKCTKYMGSIDAPTGNRTKR